MLGRLQLVVCVRLGAQPLNGVHHIGLLREHGIAELLRPVELAAHHGEHARRCGERLHAFIPALLVGFRLQCIALEVLVFVNPSGRLNDLERISRRHQHLGQQRVGIKRDRRNQRIELFRLESLIGGRTCRR